jgi:hypothetical protein
MIKFRHELKNIIDLSLPAAEVGVASGVFSFEILTWGVKHLYCVDLWAYHPDLRGMSQEPQSEHDLRFEQASTLMKDFDNVTFLKGLSVDMVQHVPDNSLGFVYLDACHFYKEVKQDLEIWLPKLVKGGIMAGHDYLNEGYQVKAAVNDFCKGRFKINVIPDHSPEQASFYFINK